MGHQNALCMRRHMEESLPAFWVTVAKPFLLKIQYSKPSKIIEICTLHVNFWFIMVLLIICILYDWVLIMST